MGKSIPSGDIKFAAVARNIARTIGRDPARFGLCMEDAEKLTRAVTEFRDALAVARQSKNPANTRRKDDARDCAKRIIQKCQSLIRVNDRVSAADKMIVYVRERPVKLRQRKCPRIAPLVLFKGSINEGGLSGKMHRLHVCQELGPGTRAKPDGVERIELFVEWVAPDEPIPNRPGDLCGGRAWYIGSFKKNRIKVAFPMPPMPMRIVYWVRYAGPNCDVGPFSRPVEAGYEGAGKGRISLPDPHENRRHAQKVVITSAMRALPDQSEQVEQLCGVVGGLLPEPRP